MPDEARQPQPCLSPSLALALAFSLARARALSLVLCICECMCIDMFWYLCSHVCESTCARAPTGGEDSAGETQPHAHRRRRAWYYAHVAYAPIPVRVMYRCMHQTCRVCTDISPRQDIMYRCMHQTRVNIHGSMHPRCMCAHMHTCKHSARAHTHT